MNRPGWLIGGTDKWGPLGSLGSGPLPSNWRGIPAVLGPLPGRFVRRLYCVEIAS